jgi:drug/metabolite transporter (DMT)-like permease
VTAILGGLGAALCWTVTSFFGQRAGRALGPLNTFAWGSILAASIIVIPAVITTVGSPLSSIVIVDLIAAGTLNVFGLIAQFSALSRDNISVVVPISSAEGAVAALLAVVTGTSFSTLGWFALALVVGGVSISAASQWRKPTQEGTSPLVPASLAILAALLFGAGIFFQGRAGLSTPLGLAVAPPSLIGVVLVVLPMASTRRLAPPGRAFGWVIGVAAAELLGFVCYVIGARHSVPVAAILSVQYATISVFIGMVALGERLSKMQVVGFAATIAGITLISIAN